MGKSHRLAERRHEILLAIEKTGKLTVEESSTLFDVSEVTIRQDFQALHEQGFLLRTRGGAVSNNRMAEFSFDVRQQQNATQKRRIGQAAAKFISHGDTIFLDASTTAHSVIPYIKNISELTVITNSIKASMNFLDSPQIQVILIGGNLRRESISLVGSGCEELLAEINIQTGFFGARGVTVEEGLTDVNVDEVGIKKIMVDRCRQVVGVIDSTKWGKVAAYTFARLDQIDCLVSDKDTPGDLVEETKENQVEIILV